MSNFRRCLALLSLVAGLVSLAVHQGTATAQPKATPITVAPQAPTINAALPLGVARGQALELTLTGTNLADPTGLWTSFPAKVTIPADMNNGKDAAKVRVKIEVSADAPLGFHSLRLATKAGISNARLFCVDEFPQLDEVAGNGTKEKAQVVPVPGVVVGRVDAEQSDFFKFTAKPGQRLTVEVIARRLGSALDPMLKLYDAKTMREMPGFYSDDEPGLQSDARLTKTFPSGGDFIVEVRDARHLGGPESYYRLRIADVANAMAVMPAAIQRGQKASVTFAGKEVAGLAPVEVTMPADGIAVSVSPKGPGGSGWPVPVAGSDIKEIVEVEPNNDIAKAQRVELPVGITGRFLEKQDLDCFIFAAKKGVKYSATAETYEINSPAEVYLIVKDAKGAELAKSNPANTPAKVEFTPPADGDFVVVAEHLNYAHGPVEVYHLTIEPSEPDFAVSLMLDRFEAAPGGTTVIPIAALTRNGYAGPVELSVVGAGFEGTTIITTAAPAVPPAPPVPGAPVGLLPLTVKPGTAAGAYEIRVAAKATINGKVVTRYATVTDIVKAGLNGLGFPPRETLTSLGVAVIPTPTFALTMKLVPAEAAKGTPANLTVTATRAAGFAEEIALAPIGLPATVTLAVKPIPKGANEVVIPLTAAPAAAVGPVTFTFRGTAKAAGKDVAVYAAPLTVTVVEAKKVEPKKEEPKKVEPKKEEPKKVEPKKEEPKKVEPKKEEPKKVEPKKEEPKKK